MQELANLLALLKKLEVDHCVLARQAMNGTPHAHLELAIYHRGRAHSYAEVSVKLRRAIEIETHGAVVDPS
jgi:hypothetical protein